MGIDTVNVGLKSDLYSLHFLIMVVLIHISLMRRGRCDYWKIETEKFYFRTWVKLDTLIKPKQYIHIITMQIMFFSLEFGAAIILLSYVMIIQY